MVRSPFISSYYVCTELTYYKLARLHPLAHTTQQIAALGSESAAKYVPRISPRPRDSSPTTTEISTDDRLGGFSLTIGSSATHAPQSAQRVLSCERSLIEASISGSSCEAY